MFLVVTLLGALSFDIGRHAWDVPGVTSDVKRERAE